MTEIHLTEGDDTHVSVNHDLAPGVDGEIIFGLGGMDVLIRTGNWTVLNGGDDNDQLAVYGSNNVLEGGDGNDTLQSSYQPYLLLQYVGLNILIGGSGDDILEIYGLHDTAKGGAGNDTYHVIESGQVWNSTASELVDIKLNQKIVENLDEGVDTIITYSYRFSLANIANVENLISYQDSVVLEGNNLANKIEAASGANTLRGAGGDDILAGAQGDDQLFGGSGNDIIYGGDIFADQIPGNDRMYGGAGDDYMEGHLGEDLMIGGTGNDSYVINSSNDVVVERAGEGIDTVYVASIDAIAVDLSNVERIVWEIPVDFELIGSDDADTLTGSWGNNTLSGGKGHDILHGGKGNDVLLGGQGNDTLEGGTGYDVLNGGEGRDTASFENSNAVTIGLGEQYIFRARSKLPATQDKLVSIENLTGSKTGGDQLTGNRKANVIKGLGGDDKINGKSGNDWMSGGEGKDKLTGGAGSDKFFFDSAASGGDRILDFEHADQLLFRGKAFAHLQKGALDQDNFLLTSNNVALDGNDHFIFNVMDMTLWFDHDGDGSARAVKILTMENMYFLTAGDLTIV
jgi:trimeric autotransporter adhesin